MQKQNGKREYLRQYGKFYVTTELVYSGDIWPVLLKMKFIPIRVEMLFARDEFEYIGISPLFKHIPFGEEIPRYSIIIQDSGKDISIDVSAI